MTGCLLFPSKTGFYCHQSMLFGSLPVLVVFFCSILLVNGLAECTDGIPARYPSVLKTMLQSCVSVAEAAGTVSL